jgi:subtilisin family serine protease
MRRGSQFGIALLIFLLLGFLAFVFWWFARPAAPGKTAKVSSTVPDTPATAAALPRATAMPPVPVPGPGMAAVPRTDSWAGAQTVASAEERAADGKSVNRIRVVKTDFKYPLLRLEETWAIDPSDGRESLLKQSSMVADHVMVKPRPGLGERELAAFTARHGLAVRSRLPASGIFLVSLPDASVLGALPEAIALLRRENSPAMLVEPDYLVRIAATPNDRNYSQLWGMHNTGQSGGTLDADIDAPEAWDNFTGSADVLVGIIDTGLSYTHPDLVNNMWTNPAEIPGNLIDDDGNGYVDDVRGWDFYGNDKNPDDLNGHGTHCAGTIGAEGNNGIGVAGVTWYVSMVALRGE